MRRRRAVHLRVERRFWLRCQHLHGRSCRRRIFWQDSGPLPCSGPEHLLIPFPLAAFCAPLQSVRTLHGHAAVPVRRREADSLGLLCHLLGRLPQLPRVRAEPHGEDSLAQAEPEAPRYLPRVSCMVQEVPALHLRLGLPDRADAEGKGGVVGPAVGASSRAAIHRRAPPRHGQVHGGAERVSAALRGEDLRRRGSGRDLPGVHRLR
mmetsp:Transcript_48416/g.149580  ORF Transcript_48416/g.149580 Transcript_48416/m.149580 type:complete len:207 (+) Transcript_48416:443-1063(+)